MLEEVLELAREKIANAKTSKVIQDLKIELLGKKSKIVSYGAKIKDIEPAKKREFGIEVNNIKQEILKLFSQQLEIIEREEMQKRLQDERLDVTVPAAPIVSGKLHVITKTWHIMAKIFAGLGFSIEDGPDIETEYLNFDALNIKPNHPARQMHDSFYLSEETKMLRTHTSPVQIRTLLGLKNKKDVNIKFISPGRTYRADSDQTHTPMFHQIELLYIAKDANIGQLKYIIRHFVTEFFNNPDIEFRFRPSYFPFTEPSMEVDIKMPTAKNQGDKWLEVLGCGMVHPSVLENCGIDSTRNKGFALGAGIERFAMLKYDIKDLRSFFTSSTAWLEHYGSAHYNIDDTKNNI